MTLWNCTADLETMTTTLNDEGVPVETAVPKTVCVNKRTIGATTWVAARSAGLKADAEISLRSCDYDGQQRLVFDGTEYEVERVSNTGEYTVLTLKRRLSDG